MMKHLQEYIVENIVNIFEASAKFDKAVNTIDELENAKQKIFTQYDNHGELVKQFLNDILSSYNGIEIENKLIYTDGNVNYIKIPYAYKDTIIKVITNNEQYKNTFTLINTGLNKIIVKLNKKEVLETGSGSLKTVNTRDQEVATCVIWNNFVESLNGVKNNEIEEYTKEDINNIMNDIKESSVDFDKGWVYSLNKQILCIKNYLEKIGENPTDYYAERYGGDNRSFSDKWKVSKSYEKFISTYIKYLSNTSGGIAVKKDNYDPTDIIIYKKEIENELKEYFDNLTTYTDISSAKENFINDIYLNSNKFNVSHPFIGLSLKKISDENGNYQIFNVGKSESPNEVYEIVKFPNVNNGKIVVGGNFIFGHITYTEDEKLKMKDKVSSHYCTITFRQFGTQKNGQPNIGMDVTMSDINGKIDGPSLGKVPVRDWALTIFDGKKPTNIKEGRELLMKYFEDNKDNIEKIKNDLTFLIQEAIKVGPNCLPFVLIH